MMQQVSFALQRVRRVAAFQQQASSLVRKHGAPCFRSFSLRPTTPVAAATGVMGARPAVSPLGTGASRLEKRAAIKELFDEKDRELLEEDEIAAGEAEAQIGDEEDGGPLSSPGAEDDIDDLPIIPAIKDRLKSDFGITKLFSVQSRAFAPITNRKDLIIKSRTGTGKTLAFCLPLAQRILEDNTRPRPGVVRAVVLEPTRELAKQVVDELAKVSPRLRTAAIYGGVGYEGQERAIKAGLDILVGTPGRVIDHLEKGNLHLDSVSMCVIDEADRMLQIGFTEAVERILQDMPKAPERQTVLCSATMPSWVNGIVNNYLTNPETIDCVGSSELRVADTITHYALCAPHSLDQKVTLLADVVDCHTTGRVIIFTQTKNDADFLASHPAFRGQARALHGDIPQARREDTLKDFKQEVFRILVATDVAARGIDVPEVEMVVQNFFPQESDSFIHRAGRTGRAGRKGINVLVVSEAERGMLPVLTEKTGAVFAPMYPPSQKDTIGTAVARVKEEMQTVLGAARASTGEFRHGSSVSLFMPQVDALLADPKLNLDPKQLAAALLTMTCGSKFGTRRSLLFSRPGFATCVISGSGMRPVTVRDVLRLVDSVFGSARGGMPTGRVIYARNVGAIDIPVSKVDSFLQSVNHQLPHEVDGFKIDFPNDTLPVEIYNAAVSNAVMQRDDRFSLDSTQGGRQRSAPIGGGGGRFGRPSFGGDRGRPSFDNDDRRPSFRGDGDRRPSFGGDRRSSYGSDRGRPSFDNDDRRASFRGDGDRRPSFGDRRPSFGQSRDDRTGGWTAPPNKESSRRAWVRDLKFDDDA